MFTLRAVGGEFYLNRGDALMRTGFFWLTFHDFLRVRRQRVTAFGPADQSMHGEPVKRLRQIQLGTDRILNQIACSDNLGKLCRSPLRGK